MPSSSERRGGFVLMEAVIALAIISLVALAVLGASVTQVRTADKAQLLLIAASLADERLATLKALRYDDLRAPPDSLVAGAFPPPFEEYAWRAHIVEADGDFDLFSIGVVVSVHDERYVLNALVHEPRPQVAVGAQEP